MSHTRETLAEEPRERQYRILNDDFTKDQEPTHHGFLPFSRLPPELRLRIWTLSLPCQRWLRLEVRGSWVPYAPRDYETRLISSYRQPNTLLYVNREAREVFTSMYRVSVPLGRDGARILRFNPETDTIHLCVGSPADAFTIAAFIHDILIADPKHVGIRNLAMEGMNDMAWLSELSPARLTQEEAASVAKVLRNIRRFYAVISPTFHTRNMLGPLAWRGAKFHHNISIPIAPQTQEFKWIDTDPRAEIREDLVYTAVTCDPRRYLFNWRRAEQNFGIRQSGESEVEIRYVLAIWPLPYDDRPAVRNRNSLVEFLKLEDGIWDDLFYNQLLRCPIPEDRLRKENDHRQAAGFWTFPPDTFGEIPTVSPHSWQHKMIFDLSGSTPGLGLFYL